jgi:hypothetical protein
MRIISIEDPSVIRAILNHLGIWLVRSTHAGLDGITPSVVYWDTIPKLREAV